MLNFFFIILVLIIFVLIIFDFYLFLIIGNFVKKYIYIYIKNEFILKKWLYDLKVL